MTSFPESHIHVYDEQIELYSRSKNIIDIKYWELPEDFCPIHNFVFDVEHRIDFKSLVNHKQEYQCIFSPFSVDYMKISMMSSLEIPEVYGANDTTKLNLEPEYIFNTPFFIRLLPSQIPYTFDFTAFSSRSRVHYCHFEPISIAVHFLAVPPQWQGLVDNIKCTNSHEPLLFLAKFTFGFSTLIFFVSIILFMHFVFWKKEEDPNMTKQDAELLITEEINV